jgi:hypothetical protein
MSRVVEVDFRMAVEADGNGIRYVVGAAFALRVDVVCLHPEAAESMADAAPTMARDHQSVHLVALEGHQLTSSVTESNNAIT